MAQTDERPGVHEVPKVFLFGEFNVEAEIERLHRDEIGPLLDSPKTRWKDKMHLMCKYAALTCDRRAWRTGRLRLDELAVRTRELREFAEAVKKRCRK
jgi:hypothetical protein